MRPPPSVGIVAALPDEGRCLGAPRSRAGARIRLHDSVFLHLAGIGPERAAAAAAALLDQGVSALVSWGYAGALDSALRPGTLVLAERVRTVEGLSYATDSAWLDALRHAAGPALAVAGGTLLSCAAVIRNAAEKQRLHRSFTAVAVDMESAAVAAVARAARVPFVAIRSISDAADAALPTAALAAVDPDGRLRPVRGLACLARRPKEMAPLLSLMTGTRNARLALRTLSRLAGPRLLAPLNHGFDLMPRST